MKIKCENIKLDTPTANGRIYPKESFQKAIDEYNKRDHRFGTICDSHKLDIDGISQISKISHEILSVDIDGDDIYADIKILETPKGDLLKYMLNTEKFNFEIVLIVLGSLDDGVVKI